MTATRTVENDSATKILTRLNRPVATFNKYQRIDTILLERRTPISSTLATLGPERFTISTELRFRKYYLRAHLVQITGENLKVYYDRIRGAPYINPPAGSFSEPAKATRAIIRDLIAAIKARPELYTIRRA